MDEEAEDRQYKWEVEPHPYDSQYDTFVTDSDDDARDAILYAAEMLLWDQNDGGKKTLTVTYNVWADEAFKDYARRRWLDDEARNSLVVVSEGEPRQASDPRFSRGDCKQCDAPSGIPSTDLLAHRAIARLAIATAMTKAVEVYAQDGKDAASEFIRDRCRSLVDELIPKDANDELDA